MTPSYQDSQYMDHIHNACATFHMLHPLCKPDHPTNECNLLTYIFALSSTWFRTNSALEGLDWNNYSESALHFIGPVHLFQIFSAGGGLVFCCLFSMLKTVILSFTEGMHYRK